MHIQIKWRNIAWGTTDPGYWVYNLNHVSDWKSILNYFGWKRSFKLRTQYPGSVVPLAMFILPTLFWTILFWYGFATYPPNTYKRWKYKIQSTASLPVLKFSTTQFPSTTSATTWCPGRDLPLAYSTLAAVAVRTKGRHKITQNMPNFKTEMTTSWQNGGESLHKSRQACSSHCLDSRIGRRAMLST